MSMQSQFKSKILLEKIEPLTVIKDEPEVVETCMDDVLDSLDEHEEISPDIKDEIDIAYDLISDDLIKSEPIPNNLLGSEHLESVETQIFVQTENTPFNKTEFENLVKTEDNSNEHLNVEEIQKSTHEKRKAKMEKCRLEYHCNKCEYKTLWLSHLKRHKVIHSKSKENQYLYCYHCPYKCKNGITLQHHIIEHFKKHPEHRSICDEIESKNHLKTNTKRYSCKKCGFRTYHVAKLKQHELTHEAERDDQYLKYHCDQCKYKTFRLQDFNRHELTHLKPERILYFYCYYCSFKSIQKRSLKIHIFTHFKNEEVPFHCYICDFVTQRRDFIVEHFKKHPEHRSICDETEYKNKLKTKKQKRCYSCKTCWFRTCHYEKFNLHELTHKTEVEMDDQHLKYHCDKCSYKTFRYQDFKRHKLIHLKPEEISYFYCYHCSYKNKRKDQFKIHIFKHFKNEEVPFHCYICDFVTVKRDLIIKHFKTHPKYRSKCDETDHKMNLVKKRYRCKKCMFRTYHYEKLKFHELTHKEMDDRYLKYQCNKCTYNTFNKGNFKVHQLVHLKPEEIQYFYCYHCSYKAKQKGNLQIHILRHFKNEVVKFHCYMCNFITLKRQSITEHIKEHSKVQVKSNINKRILS